MSGFLPVGFRLSSATRGKSTRPGGPGGRVTASSLRFQPCGPEPPSAPCPGHPWPRGRQEAAIQTLLKAPPVSRGPGVWSQDPRCWPERVPSHHCPCVRCGRETADWPELEDGPGWAESGDAGAPLGAR